MIVVWTPQATHDLAAISAYIALGSPTAAHRVAKKLIASVSALVATPNIGRTGQVPGTRELIVTPWPHIVVYRVDGGFIRVILIRHAAQQWP